MNRIPRLYLTSIRQTKSLATLVIRIYLQSDTTYKSKDSDLKLKIKLQRNYNNRIIEKIQNLKSLKFIVKYYG